jgi:hypothetical protein
LISFAGDSFFNRVLKFTRYLPAKSPLFNFLSGAKKLPSLMRALIGYADETAQPLHPRQEDILTLPEFSPLFNTGGGQGPPETMKSLFFGGCDGKK